MSMQYVVVLVVCVVSFFVFKQKAEYEMRISDWSSDVCSSDLLAGIAARGIDGSCRTGHPCPRASGIVARDTLVRLLGGAKGRSATGHILVTGPRLQCRSTGNAKGDRTGAWCAAPAIGAIS